MSLILSASHVFSNSWFTRKCNLMYMIQRRSNTDLCSCNDNGNDSNLDIWRYLVRILVGLPAVLGFLGLSRRILGQYRE